MNRPTTSISRIPGDARLPELQRSSSKLGGSRAIQQDEILELKTKIHKMEEERRLLRAKIQRMRKTIQSRNVSIRKVLSQPQKEQKIQTASQSQLQQLREEKTSLTNVLNTNKQELENLKNSDKLALSNELKIEIPIFYQEKMRLDDELSKLRDLEKALSLEFKRIQNQISNINANESAVDEIQLEIDDLTEKLFAYKKSEMKLQAAKDLHKLHKNPESFNEIKKKLEDEITDVKAEIEKSNHEIQEIQESEDSNIEYLNQIIQGQIATIKAYLYQKYPYYNDDELSKTESNDIEDDNEKQQYT
ncbi:hypothetical protein M9Y10_004740 [Tritrichomonas musculus]|uniref:Lebercilin domain-containing protein n=1 Tax=Tritrichomonas musculus TaxID=1915356 RepID=A0ABR2JJE7_9EUKA